MPEKGRAGKRGPVPHRERLRWTEEEDLVLLATLDLTAAEAIEELVKRGFPERTQPAVWERRKEVRRRMAEQGTHRPVKVIEMDLAQQRQRLMELQQEYDAALRQQQARLRDELEVIEARLKGEPNGGETSKP